MGSIRATNEILDRLMGKPPQAIANIDLRAQNRDEVIAAILESLRVMKVEDEEPTIH